MVPRARYRVTRPSGATPTALMPAPQTTATPQCGPDPSSASTASGRPERRIAKVSLTTVALSLHPWACTAVACSTSSSGRSALARQATVCRASGPSRRWSSRASSWAAACLTTASRISTVWSTPTSWALMPGPRAEASSVPSPATRATSVLLLPPSMASTAGPGAAVSAKARALIRAQGKRHQGVGGVVVGGFDRGPGDHVVLIGGGLGVERREMTRAAGAHPVDRAQANEIVRAARPVGGRAQLDVAAAGERARQVGDLALHAVRVHRAGADHEGGAPAVGAEREVQLLLRERGELAGAAVLLVQRVGNVQAERVRRGVGVTQLAAERERVALGLGLARPQLRGHDAQQRPRRDRERPGLPHGLDQLGHGDGTGVLEVERVVVPLGDVRPGPPGRGGQVRAYPRGRSPGGL